MRDSRWKEARKRLHKGPAGSLTQIRPNKRRTHRRLKPTTRMCNGDEDLLADPPVLARGLHAHDRRQVTWEVARWDYWRWPRVESWGDGPLEEKVALWELPDGKIVAVLNAEGKGEAYLQVHPHLPTPELEEEMI